MNAASEAIFRPVNRLLKMAIVGGVESAVKLHVERGDDLNARDDCGFTPLMLAASRNRAGGHLSDFDRGPRRYFGEGRIRK